MSLLNTKHAHKVKTTWFHLKSSHNELQIGCCYNPKPIVLIQIQVDREIIIHYIHDPGKSHVQKVDCIGFLSQPTTNKIGCTKKLSSHSSCADIFTGSKRPSNAMHIMLRVMLRVSWMTQPDPWTARLKNACGTYANAWDLCWVGLSLFCLKIPCPVLWFPKFEYTLELCLNGSSCWKLFNWTRSSDPKGEVERPFGASKSNVFVNQQENQ